MSLILTRTYMNELSNLASNLVSEIHAYETNKTKAGSLRIRKLTQRLNNIGPSIRAELIAADKAS